MAQNTLRKVYDPVGRCIYCGSTAYAPDSTRFLATEHIIPLALSGTLDLPQASCRRCERIINPWETKLLKGALLGCRTHLGLETRRPKDRPKALPLFDPRMTPDRKMMVPIEDYPASLLLATFDAPHLLTGVIFGDDQVAGVWMHYFKDVAELLAKKYGLDVFATTSLDVFALCRTLGKIAHAYTVAELGIDGFVHMLPNYIVGQHYDEWASYYVGGLPRAEPSTSNLHEIEIEIPTGETWRYVVVRIRLFASVGAPTYRIVSGQRLAPTKPVDVLLGEAGVLRNLRRMPAALQIRPPIPLGPLDLAAPFANEARGPLQKQWFRAMSEYPPRE